MSEEKREDGELSRREFFKDAGLMVGGAALGSAALLAGAPVETAAAQTAATVKLEVYDPRGAYEVTQLFAPRLPDLTGKTICELSNGGWQFDRTFPAIRQLLQKQFPTAKFIPYTELPEIASVVDAASFAETAKQLKAKGCQAVIVGNSG